MKKDSSIEVEWTIINLNKKALELQTSNKLLESLMIFRRLEELVKLHSSVKLQLLTYNNIAAYYIKRNDLQSALDYLRTCCNLIPPDTSSHFFQIGVLLNISAIKSKLKNHKDSLSYALKALQLLDSCPNSTLKVAAYYSIGLEYDYLGQNRLSVDYYSSGYDYSVKALGNSHALTVALSSAMKHNRKSYTKVVNEICILSDNFPNLRRKSVCDRVYRENITREEEGIKIDTTPWLDGEDWRTRTSSQTPAKNAGKAWNGFAASGVSKSFNFTGKVKEKLGMIGSRLESIDKKIDTIKELANNKRFLTKREEKKARIVNAARVIQRGFRKYLKKRYGDLGGHKSKSVIKEMPFFIIQDFGEDSRYCESSKPSNKSIKSSFRRLKKVNKNKRSLLENIIFIQKHVRGYLARKLIIRKLIRKNKETKRY